MIHLKYSLQKSFKSNTSSILVDIHNDDKIFLHIFIYIISKWYNKSCQLPPLHTNRKVQFFVLWVPAFAHYGTMKYLQREG